MGLAVAPANEKAPLSELLTVSFDLVVEDGFDWVLASVFSDRSVLHENQVTGLDALDVSWVLLFVGLDVVDEMSS